MDKKEVEVENKWKLGKGEKGTFSDLKILVKQEKKSSLRRGKNIENTDENLLKEIENQLLKNWIRGYEKNGVFLAITIIHVGCDNERRKYAIENSVNGAMHKALPKIGIVPPQIFAL